LRGARCLAVCRQRDQRALDARHGRYRLFGSQPQGLKRLGLIGRHGDRKIDFSIGDEDIRDHAAGDEVAFEIRTANLGECFQHLVLRYIRHVELLLVPYAHSGPAARRTFMTVI